MYLRIPTALSVEIFTVAMHASAPECITVHRFFQTHVGSFQPYLDKHKSQV